MYVYDWLFRLHPVIYYLPLYEAFLYTDANIYFVLPSPIHQLREELGVFTIALFSDAPEPDKGSFSSGRGKRLRMWVLIAETSRSDN